MGFWILLALAAIVTLAVLGYAMFIPGAPATGDASDVQIYRDQLKELERDQARGVIGEEEAARARVEISRRLLEADRAAASAAASKTAPRGATLVTLAIMAVVVGGGSAWLYWGLGAPGYWDMPLQGRIEAAETARAQRPNQDALEAELPAWDGPPPNVPSDYLDLVTSLRAAVAERPDDMEGLSLLATHEASLGNYVAARRAMGRLIELRGGEVTGTELAQYSDLLVLAADGTVSPEAEAVLDRALALNPGDPIARYYTGLMFAQTGRPDVAFGLWRDLLTTSRPSDPWVPPIRRQIEVLAMMAGEDYTPPVPQSDEDAATLAAAAQMPRAEREPIVAPLVNRLMSQLAEAGGPARDWANVIRGLGLLDAQDRAADIYEESRGVFASQPDDLILLRRAAVAAGIIDGDPHATPDAAAPGPTDDDVEAAAEMSDEERGSMIASMVSRLADRLDSEGGTPEDWVRLINAYGVMGDAAQAKAARDTALGAYAGDATAEALIRDAATAAGVTE